MQALPFWIASLVTGVIAVLYTKLFEWAEKMGQSLYKANGVLIFILAPTGFLLAWLLVKQLDTYASDSGIPQVMAAIELTMPEEKGRLSSY